MSSDPDPRLPAPDGDPQGDGPRPPDADVLAVLDRLADQIESDPDLLAQVPLDVVLAEVGPERAAALVAAVEATLHGDRRAAGDRPPVRPPARRPARRWAWSGLAVAALVAALLVWPRADGPALADADRADLVALARPPAKGDADPADEALAEASRLLLDAWDAENPPDQALARQAAAQFDEARALASPGSDAAAAAARGAALAREAAGSTDSPLPDR